MKPETVYWRAVACGCVIGGCLENSFGEPLTKREAHKLAEYENERSARRREQKLPGALITTWTASFNLPPPLLSVLLAFSIHKGWGSLSKPMTHDTIKDTCERLALTVAQAPADGLRRNWNATRPGQRVYWSTSFAGYVIGSPRVITNGADTHARSLREIKYLLTR